MWYDMILIILINEYSIYLKKKKKNWIVLVPILYYLIIQLLVDPTLTVRFETLSLYLKGNVMEG
jgi:hypothetical protein